MSPHEVITPQAVEIAGDISAFEEVLPALQDTMYVFMGGKYTFDELRGLKSIVETGSLRLTESTDPETVQSVMKAREEFFGAILGWDDPEHPLAKSYDEFKSTHVRIVPLDTFIEAQSYEKRLGLDGVKIVHALPAAISLAPESVRSKMENFKALGLDGVKIVHALPAAISYAPESVRSKMENFKALGLDGVKIVHALPAAISLAPESVRSKMENFKALGLDGVKIVHALPAAIGYAPEGIRTKVTALIEAGLIQHGSEISLQSDAAIAAFFILPIESLLFYLAETPKDTMDINTVARDARKYAEKVVGTPNAMRRKQEYFARLPRLYSRLGQVALDHAAYITLPKGFTLREVA